MVQPSSYNKSYLLESSISIAGFILQIDFAREDGRRTDLAGGARLRRDVKLPNVPIHTNATSRSKDRIVAVVNFIGRCVPVDTPQMGKDTEGQSINYCYPATHDLLKLP